MFAVPGWAVSADKLKSQKAVEGNSAAEKKLRKKRKRGALGGPKDNVKDSQSLEKRWKSHVERHGDGKPASKFRKKMHPRRTALTDANLEPVQSGKRDRQAGRQAASGVLPVKHVSNVQDREPIAADTNTVSSSLTKQDKPSKKATKMTPQVPSIDSAQKESTLTPMQSAMRQKLVSARFRHLNQTLYTTPSSEAKTLFESNPSFYSEYHLGFRQQVSSWPENPVDSFVRELSQRASAGLNGGRNVKSQAHQTSNTLASLPRSRGVCHVADLGCGDAMLAQKLEHLSKDRAIRISSFDLQGSNAYVTKADISNLPLEAGTVDIAIFCLALMGTNWIDFIEEAWRVLHWKGELWIAEIKSRFSPPNSKRVDHSVGKRKKKVTKADLQEQKRVDGRKAEEELAVEVDGRDDGVESSHYDGFVQVLRRRGFELHGEGSVDSSNKMFVKLRFVKSLSPQKGKGRDITKSAFIKKKDMEDASDGAEAATLKPCLYKTR